MQTVVFATFITNDLWLNRCAKPLMNSSKYFHPDIPFEIFTLDSIRANNPNITIGNTKAIIGKTLSKNYDLVVLFDADSIITARLDEILANDYDVASVRNCSDHGSVHMESNVDQFQVCGICSKSQYMNAGIVACRDSTFFDEWDSLRNINRFDLDQGTLNMVAYSGRYKTKMLDPPEVPYYYGVSNSWGNITPWDSWKDIKLRNNKLYLKNKSGIEKQVKVLHKAGSGRLANPDDKFNKKLFNDNTYRFIKEISS